MSIQSASPRRIRREMNLLQRIASVEGPYARAAQVSGFAQRGRVSLALPRRSEEAGRVQGGLLTARSDEDEIVATGLRPINRLFGVQRQKGN